MFSNVYKYTCFIVLLFLASCKSYVNLGATITELRKAKHGEILSSNLVIEISRCKDRETEMPSDDVFKLQKQIPWVFQGAQYVKCVRENFESYAFFTIPIAVDKKADKEPVDSGILNLVLHENGLGNDNGAIVISVPNTLKNKLNKLKKSNRFMNPFDDLKINFQLNNDSGKLYTFTILGGYLDDEPYQLGSFDNKGGKMLLSYNGYAAEALVKGEPLYLVYSANSDN